MPGILQHLAITYQQQFVDILFDNGTTVLLKGHLSLTKKLDKKQESDIKFLLFGS